ncbi:lem3 cdc50 family protein [Cystoisospora suis]|uniref:Lem3 cdc50 family protein n=1 Tax=Cystoisospora suis TaxID=483139 RepID=A0A2C6KCC4_9APIC|nr:lem3 cdc50 family protein [Cystoisospora suis]
MTLAPVIGSANYALAYSSIAAGGFCLLGVCFLWLFYLCGIHLRSKTVAETDMKAVLAAADGAVEIPLIEEELDETGEGGGEAGDEDDIYCSSSAEEGVLIPGADTRKANAWIASEYFHSEGSGAPPPCLCPAHCSASSSFSSKHPHRKGREGRDGKQEDQEGDRDASHGKRKNGRKRSHHVRGGGSSLLHPESAVAAASSYRRRDRCRSRSEGEGADSSYEQRKEKGRRASFNIEGDNEEDEEGASSASSRVSSSSRRKRKGRRKRRMSPEMLRSLESRVRGSSNASPASVKIEPHVLPISSPGRAKKTSVSPESSSRRGRSHKSSGSLGQVIDTWLEDEDQDREQHLHPRESTSLPEVDEGKSGTKDSWGGGEGGGEQGRLAYHREAEEKNDYVAKQGTTISWSGSVDEQKLRKKKKQEDEEQGEERQRDPAKSDQEDEGEAGGGEGVVTLPYDYNYDD